MVSKLCQYSRRVWGKKESIKDDCKTQAIMPQAAMVESVLNKKGRVKKKSPEPIRVARHGSGLL